MTTSIPHEHLRCTWFVNGVIRFTDALRVPAPLGSGRNGLPLWGGMHGRTCPVCFTRFRLRPAPFRTYLDPSYIPGALLSLTGRHVKVWEACFLKCINVTCPPCDRMPGDCHIRQPLYCWKGFHTLSTPLSNSTWNLSLLTKSGIVFVPD